MRSVKRSRFINWTTAKDARLALKHRANSKTLAKKICKSLYLLFHALSTASALAQNFPSIYNFSNKKSDNLKSAAFTTCSLSCVARMWISSLCQVTLTVLIAASALKANNLIPLENLSNSSCQMYKCAGPKQHLAACHIVCLHLHYTTLPLQHSNVLQKGMFSFSPLLLLQKILYVAKFCTTL